MIAAGKVSTMAAAPPISSRRRGAVLPWTTCVALSLFMLSVIRFVNRDALGRDVGSQGILQFACVAAAALLCGGIVWRRAAILKPDAFLLAMVGFSCFALASAGRSFWPPLSASKAIVFLAVVWTASGSCARIGSRRVIKVMYVAVVGVACFGLALAAAGVYPLFEADEFSGRTRLTLFLLHPGVVADLAAFAVLTGRLLPRTPPVWLQLLLVMMGILTSAKGATIALIVALVISLAPWRRLTIQRLAIAAVCLCATVLVASIVLYTAAPGGIAEGPLTKLYGSNLKDELLTFNGRVELWKSVVPLFQRALVLGFGLDGAREMLLDVFDWSGNAHNALFELVLAAGVPGALVFVLGWALALVRGAALPAGERAKVMAVHVYLIITSIVSPIWTTSQYISVFYLTIMNATGRERQSSESRGAHMGYSFRNESIVPPLRESFTLPAAVVIMPTESGRDA